MTPSPLPPPTFPGADRAGRLRRFGIGTHIAFVSVAGVLVLGALGLFVRMASRTPPPALPPTIETVNWSDPSSATYCVACHRQLAPATAGLDVQRGHSQNVTLNTVQRRAVQEMQGVVGEKNTLVCMSCHKLGRNMPFMLADALTDSRLCQNCHPGHYAQGTPHDLRVSAPNDTNRFGVTAAAGGPCSACHLSHAFAREIIPSPLDPDGFCVSCHREYGVAAGHARNKMPHPESQCLQCHDPHDTTYGNFLKQPVNGLCIQCHRDYDRGPLAGMHPIGQMQRDIPVELLKAGSIQNANTREITCATCHSVHDSDQDALLVLARESNRLCESCHAESLACSTASGAPSGHAGGPILNKAQQAVVRSWNATVGRNDELLCVSCHRVHGGASTKGLVAFDAANVSNCLGCHPNQVTVLRSQHDLFKAGGEVGATAAGSGNACNSCHSGHGDARDRASSTADPTGVCISCHQGGGLAAAKPVAGGQHPQTACTACHEPHAGGLAGMLRKPEFELCVSCHAEESTLVGGPHDRAVSSDSVRWDAAHRSGGVCLSCHVPHGGQRADLFRLGGQRASENHDDVCLTCHRDANWRSTGSVAAIHSSEISCDESKVAAPLVPKDAAGNMRIGCRTCHNPHGGPDPVHLARVAPDAPTEALCLSCHESKSHITQTGHAADKLAGRGLTTDSCKPCHAMHAAYEDTWGQMLSPRFLPGANERIGNAIDQRLPCLACHHENGLAPLPTVYTHPEIKLAVPLNSSEPGYLPLFDAAGRETPEGQITCRTCHVSHGRLELLEQAPSRAAGTTEQRLMRMQVRAFVGPNRCTECHGVDGRRKFLFFHDPQRRGGQASPSGPGMR